MWTAAVQCSKVQCRAVQCSKVQGRPVQWEGGRGDRGQTVLTNLRGAIDNQGPSSLWETSCWFSGFHNIFGAAFLKNKVECWEAFFCLGYLAPS